MAKPSPSPLHFFIVNTMRAQRAKLKSRRDDQIIAQGKRSAALGYGPKNISLFSLPVWRSGSAPNRKGKKSAGGMAMFLLTFVFDVFN